VAGEPAGYAGFLDGSVGTALQEAWVTHATLQNQPATVSTEAWEGTAAPARLLIWQVVCGELGRRGYRPATRWLLDTPGGCGSRSLLLALGWMVGTTGLFERHAAWQRRLLRELAPFLSPYPAAATDLLALAAAEPAGLAPGVTAALRPVRQTLGNVQAGDYRAAL
jgi:hypothetical protein